MGLRVFLNRLLRKSQWLQALGIRSGSVSRRQLRKMTIQAVAAGSIAIKEAAHSARNSSDHAACLSKLQLQTERLTALLPFSGPREAAMIQNALEIAQEAKRTPQIAPRETGDGTWITFYTVYIPTMDGRFFYLSNTDYPPGAIVRIPFGSQDREIFGIVEKSQCFPYEKAPFPLWKMKYILAEAPKAIADTYHYAENLLDLQ